MEKLALKLIQQYMNGWRTNNLQEIISCLDKNCLVIESHGPTYSGIQDIKEWFRFWTAANSKVTKWEILSFYFCNKKETAFTEWDFSCISNNITYSLPGISIIKFSENKILSICEYRMTKTAYRWERDKLQSE